MTTTYNRPIAGKLRVELGNGEEFDASEEDMAKFGYVKRHDAYMAFNTHLCKILREAGLIERDKELTETELNPLRYLVEVAICYPNLLAHPEMAETDAEIVAIERLLRGHTTDQP